MEISILTKYINDSTYTYVHLLDEIYNYWIFFLPFQKVPDLLLTEEHIAECLSLLCKTGDGLAHAYVRLDVHDR